MAKRIGNATPQFGDGNVMQEDYIGKTTKTLEDIQWLKCKAREFYW